MVVVQVVVTVSFLYIIADTDEEDDVNAKARIKVACTISQLICSNASKQDSQALSLYQRKERETPFPFYIALKLHANSRQKVAIATFHALGISVSYGRVMDVRKDFAKAVSKQWSDDGVVVPTNIKRHVFVTSAVDNLDESGRYEFHGTAMTLTSHLTHDNMGEDPPPLKLDLPEGAPIQLPDYYAIVPYIDEYAGDVTLPSIPHGQGRPVFGDSLDTGVPEEAWLQHVCQVVLGNATELSTTPVTYFGFFSHSQQPEDIKPRSTVGVFPIFYEKAASMAMQKHAMLMAKKATEFVNPVQVPVIVGDCPLYALQKKCQWKYPDEVGESKMVCFMGFLHVEMVSQDCGGNLLAGSGWDRMFFQAKVFTSGVTVSILGGKHVKRTRYAYQLTLAWLHALRVQAYNEYCQEEWGPHVSMEMWKKTWQENPRPSATGLQWETTF